MKNNKILVLNSGSTSLKYKLFDFNLKELKSGFVENIGTGKIKSHTQALESSLKEIGNKKNIMYIGHRVVHGGGKFYNSIIIGKKELKEIEEINHLAPLHNPANLEGIKASMKLMRDARNVNTVQDELRTRNGVQRYNATAVSSSAFQTVSYFRLHHQRADKPTAFFFGYCQPRSCRTQEEYSERNRILRRRESGLLPNREKNDINRASI